MLASTDGMLMLLWLLLASYTAGLVLPFCTPRKPQTQGMVGSACASVASLIGIALGLSGLVASEPLTAIVASPIPLLAFAVRLDPLAAFFVLTISLAGLAASIYAMGYLKEFHGRVSVAALAALTNGFLLSMTLVVIADNGFFFLMAWELMSLASYFLVVTEHEKADVRYAGFFYLVMTHVGTAFVILTYLILFQSAGSFRSEERRVGKECVP